jgi:Amt family ammonium transporter
LTNSSATFTAQLIGIVATEVFVLVSSSVIWLVLKVTIGIRVSEEEEMLGCDAAEIGMEAYPDFQRVSIGGSTGISGYTTSSVLRN